MFSSIAAITIVIQLANVAGAPETVVRDAQTDVADILGDIGVAVEWTGDPRVSPRTVASVVHLTLVRYEAGSLKQRRHQVLGSATQTELGTRIALVFFQRVVEEADAYAVPVSRVLACAIAHEVGHLLQTEPAHQPTGLMRAVWTRADFRQASIGRLRFAPPANADRSSR